jgi:hypothetical protein
LCRYDLIDSFNLDEEVVFAYLTEIESRYNTLPYHNSTHAADVTQTLNFFLTRGGLCTAAQLDSQLMLACILGASVHDAGHLGVNNPFLIVTSHELALR